MRTFIYAGILIVTVASIATVGLIKADTLLNKDSQIEEKAEAISYPVATGHGNKAYFQNLEELEAKADVIVKVRATPKKEQVDIIQSGVVLDTTTKTDVVIEKVYKGNLEKGQVIPVYEPAAFVNGIYSTMEGYTLMKENGNYILFLRDNPDDTFVGIGGYQGKYSLDITTPAKQGEKSSYTKEELGEHDFIGEEAEHFNKLKDLVVKKFKQ
jgi:hypothetical protein